MPIAREFFPGEHQKLCKAARTNGLTTELALLHTGASSRASEFLKDIPPPRLSLRHSWGVHDIVTVCVRPLIIGSTTRLSESGVERTAASAVHGRIRFDETTPHPLFATMTLREGLGVWRARDGWDLHQR